MFGCTWKIDFYGFPFHLTVKRSLWPRNYFTFLFYLQTISGPSFRRAERERERGEREREREREREKWWARTDRAPVRPTIMPSLSPPCDSECFVHPSTNEIAPQHSSIGEINPHPRAPIHMTHSCPISLFLDLTLPFPHLSITLSSSSSPFDRVFGVNKCFVLIFVWFCFDFCLF